MERTGDGHQHARPPRAAAPVRRTPPTADLRSDRAVRTMRNRREGWRGARAMVAAAPSPIGPFRPRASSHLSPAGLGRRRGQSRDRSRRVQALPRSVIRRARGSRPARAEAQTLRAIPDGPHHRDDLLNARRIRRIAQTLVPWRTPGMESRHRRRRSATPSSVQQHRLHHTLLGSKDNPAIVLWVPHGHNGQPRRRDHAKGTVTAMAPIACWGASPRRAS